MADKNNLCYAPKISAKNKCEQTRIDVNGDERADTVTVCGEVEITFKGNMAQCRDQYCGLVQNCEQNMVEAGKKFTTPLAFLDLMAVAPRICGPNAAEARQKLGINTDRTYPTLEGVNDPECNITLYGENMGWYLSYPVKSDFHLIVEDLRNSTLKDALPTHRAGNTEIEIGTWGTFKFKDRRGNIKEVDGLIVNFGHQPRMGSVKPSTWAGDVSAEFPPSEVMVYIFTKDTVTYKEIGEMARLTDIIEVKKNEFTQNDAETMARKYAETHKSMQEILEGLMAK